MRGWELMPQWGALDYVLGVTRASLRWKGLWGRQKELVNCFSLAAFSRERQAGKTENIPAFS